MRFDRPLCPACQRPARSVLTTLSGRVEIAPTEDGSFERTGQTIRWDTESPVLAEAQHLLRCACGQIWPSRRLDEDSCGLPPFAPEDPSGGDPCPTHLAFEPIDPELSARIRALKPKLRSKLAANRAARRRIPPVSPPPRYDEVYFQGTAWLDRQ
jgi:hypothetical protein